jgi:hypothetical protein
MSRKDNPSPRPGRTRAYFKSRKARWLAERSATVCQCGAAPRRDVPATADVPAHYCGQCSEEHCGYARHLRERQDAQS